MANRLIFQRLYRENRTREHTRDTTGGDGRPVWPEGGDILGPYISLPLPTGIHGKGEVS